MKLDTAQGDDGILEKLAVVARLAKTPDGVTTGAPPGSLCTGEGRHAILKNAPCGLLLKGSCE
jgi:hypothetical protein